MDFLTAESASCSPICITSHINSRVTDVEVEMDLNVEVQKCPLPIAFPAIKTEDKVSIVCVSISKKIWQVSGFAQCCTLNICMCVPLSSFEWKNCSIVNMFGPYVCSIPWGLFCCVLHVEHYVRFVLSILMCLGLIRNYCRLKSVPLHKLYLHHLFAHLFQ
jgi:hypothetical protein